MLALLLASFLLLGGCTGESESSGTQSEVAQTQGSGAANVSSGNAASDNAAADSANGIAGIAAMPSPQSSLLPGLAVTDFILDSSRRTGRTTKEYVLRLKLSNSSATRYENVVATLVGAPAHIVIVDGIASVGDVPPNATILSEDTFTVRINLAISTSFDDFVWQIQGDISTPPPPPPPGGAPSVPGIYMNIDDLRIPGESTSASHRNWIELTEVMDGIRREGLGASGSTRRRTSFTFDGVHVGKLIDRSSLKLREAILAGTIFTEVKIDVVRSCGGNAYTAFALTLSIARIENFESVITREEQSRENLSFDFSRIETMYTPVNDDCSLDSPIYSTQDGELLKL